MTASLLAPPARRSPSGVLIVVGWFAAALVAGAAGVFHTPPGVPPVAIAVAGLLPPVLVAGLLLVSARFRAWAGALDLRVLTMLQAWRIAGFAFIALWAHGTLPAGFAVPAGFGDVLVGMTAPLVAMSVIGRGRWARRAFYGWTFFGVADLVVAMTLGVLHTNSPLGLLAGTDPDIDVMAVLPMSLIPTFGVPLTLVLHVLSLANAAGNDVFGVRR